MMPDKDQTNVRVMGRLDPGYFVGREEHLREIAGLSPAWGRERSLLILAAPLAGASELLRQAYDELFNAQGGPSPVYFALNRKDRTNASAARRFLRTFVLQLVAHRRQEPELISVSPTLRDLIDLAPPSDYDWVERLVLSYERASEADDERALVRLALDAPRQAASRGARSLVLLDDVHRAEELSGEVELGAEIANAAIGSGVPFVLSGLRRRLVGVLNGEAERIGLDDLARLHVESLGGDAPRALTEMLAERLGVPVNDETRDLLVQQLEGNPYFITALMQSAQARKVELTSFREFQKLYVDELMGGRIHRRFAAVLEEVVPSAVVRRNLLRLLHESAINSAGRAPVEAWLRRLDLGAPELERILAELHTYELAGFDATRVEAGPGQVWRDYLRVSYRLQVAVEPRALVVADTLVQSLKRAPQTLARHYRREAALKLGEVMSLFNFQSVPAVLLHYDRFRPAFGGATAEEIAEGLNSETDLVRLPQVIHSASCASFHPPMLLVCDEERCAVAHGFDSTPYVDANEVVWIAAEIESKLEAGRALTEVWLERLSQVARACGFARVRPWLVAPEGFSAEACELLHQRGAFGSSRQQLELLHARLGSAPGHAAGTAQAGDEFQMVIPMGEDTELIAANVAEQIARRLDFLPEDINQIKTALVEACINASEHSLSPDRKIYQRFLVENDKLTVTVSSRGLAVNPKASENGASHAEGNGAEGTAGRRGWGLKLIRTLMDEVEFERVDDGTRLRMTKYLRK